MAYTDPRSGSTLGGALKQWREESGLSLGQAADQCSISITQLLNIERDSSGPTAQLLIDLARLYKSDCVGSESQAGWAAVMGWLRLFSDLDAPTNRQMLDIVAASIREMRNLPEDGTVRMRDGEADIVLSLLDLSDDQWKSDLMASFGLSLVDAESFLSEATRRLERREHAEEPIIRRLSSAYRLDPAA